MDSPSVIHIKRKRGDEPIDSLFIESKRARRATLHFKRLENQITSVTIPVPDPPEATSQNSTIPVVLTSQPGDEIRDPLALKPRNALTHLAVQSQDQDGQHTLQIQSLKDPASMELDLHDDGFIYDVFVLSNQGSGGAVLESSSGINNTKAAATLVIPESNTEWDDERWWFETVDPDEHERLATDDEDSNAEDYYGADYPEDEDAEDDYDNADPYDGKDSDEEGPEYDYSYEVDYQDDEDDYVKIHR